MSKQLSSSFFKLLTLMVAFVATIFIYPSSAQARTPGEGQVVTVSRDADGILAEVGPKTDIGTLIKRYQDEYTASMKKPLTWETIQATNPGATIPVCRTAQQPDGRKFRGRGDESIWKNCAKEDRSVALVALQWGRVFIPLSGEVEETYAEREARLAELETCAKSVDCLSQKIIALGGTPPAPAVAPAPAVDVDMDALQSANNALQKEVTVLTSDKKTLAAANLVLRSELDTSRGSLYGLFGLAMFMAIAGFAIGRGTARPQLIGMTTALAVVDSDEATALNRRTTVRGRTGAVETEESKQVDRSVLQQELLRLREELKLKEAENTKLAADNMRYRRLNEEREERGERPASPMYSITGDKVVVQINHGAHPSAPTQHGITSSPISHNGMSKLQMLEKEFAVFTERLHRSLAKGPNDHAERLLLAKPMDDLMTAIAAAKATYIPDLVKLPPINPPPRKQAGAEKLLPPEDEEKTREIRVDALRKEASLESPSDSSRKSRRTIPGTGERPVLVPQGAYDSSRTPYTEAFREEVTHDESAGDRPTNDIISDRETVPHPDSIRAQAEIAELKAKKAARRNDPVIRRLIQRQARLRNGNADLQLALQEANAREEALLPNAERLAKFEELALYAYPKLQGLEAARRFEISSLRGQLQESKDEARRVEDKHDKDRSVWRASWNAYVEFAQSVKEAKERRLSGSASDSEIDEMERDLRQRRLAANRAFSVFTGVPLFQIVGELRGPSPSQPEAAAPLSVPRPPRVPSTSDRSAALGGGNTNHEFPPVAHPVTRSMTPAYGTEIVKEVMTAHMNGSVSTPWTNEDVMKTHAIKRALMADQLPAILFLGADTLGILGEFFAHPALLAPDLLQGQPPETIADLTEKPRPLQDVVHHAYRLSLPSTRGSFKHTLRAPALVSPLAVQPPPPVSDENDPTPDVPSPPAVQPPPPVSDENDPTRDSNA